MVMEGGVWSEFMGFRLPSPSKKNLIIHHGSPPRRFDPTSGPNSLTQVQALRWAVKRRLSRGFTHQSSSAHRENTVAHARIHVLLSGGLIGHGATFMCRHQKTKIIFSHSCAATLLSSSSFRARRGASISGYLTSVACLRQRQSAAKNNCVL